MKPKTFAFENNKFFKSNLNIVCLLLLLIFVASCKQEDESFKTAEFTGVDGVYNFSKAVIGVVSDSISPAFVRFSRGDLFWFAEEDDVFCIPDWDSESNTYVVRYTENVLYINNKICLVCIPDSNEMIPALQELVKKDLSELQFISFNSKVPEICFPYLHEIAKIKPDVGFFIGGTLNEMAGFLKFFNPRYLFLSDFEDADTTLITGFANLEFLWADYWDANQQLPAMAGLKQLIISLGTDKGETITSNLFSNNPQLEKIKLDVSDEFDLSVLLPLVNLKELVIIDADSILNFEVINQFKKLEVLSIVGDKKIYDPLEIKLPKLKWMTFGAKFTQNEFNTFIGLHPNLEMVEFINNNQIIDLKALSVLRHLEGLTLTDTVPDLASVESLKNLKYLSLPNEFMDNEVTVENLQKAIPGALITVNEGYLCLGSGWLLLIVPLVLMFRILLRRKVTLSSK